MLLQVCSPTQKCESIVTRSGTQGKFIVAPIHECNMRILLSFGPWPSNFSFTPCIYLYYCRPDKNVHKHLAILVTCCISTDKRSIIFIVPVHMKKWQLYVVAGLRCWGGPVGVSTFKSLQLYILSFLFVPSFQLPLLSWLEGNFSKYQLEYPAKSQESVKLVIFRI